MVQRQQFRRQCSYATKGNKVRISRTPGGRLVYLHVKKAAKRIPCGSPNCRIPLNGVKCRRPSEFKQLKKTDRSVKRAYGGSLCGQCVRSKIVRSFLIAEQQCVKQVLADKEKVGEKKRK